LPDFWVEAQTGAVCSALRGGLLLIFLVRRTKIDSDLHCSLPERFLSCWIPC